MSRILLVFLGNKLANIGFGDVELLGLLARVCCTVGVDCTSVDITRVVFVGIFVVVPEIEENVH